MTRRRLPLKRANSTSSSSSTRRNADTKSLVTAGTFNGAEIGSSIRAILLGALVGGLVIFLFYPDISSLLERWQNSSAGPGFLQPNVANDGQVQQNAEKNLRSEVKKELKAKPQPSTAENSSKPKMGKKVKPPESEKKPKEPSQPENPDMCSCQCTEPVQPPKSSSPPPSRKKAKSAKKKKPRKADLMEEEELTVEEEDSVEVELMEMEEVVEYIDLKDEEDEPEPAKPGEEPRNSGHKSSEVSEEPLVLKDDQPITFTAVNPGDENVIRFGGRHKPDKDTPTEDRVDKTQTNTRSQSKPKASAKPEAPAKSSQKSKEDKTTDSKTSQTKKESREKKLSPKSKKGKESPDDADLPEEVRNFRPTYLKTFTAKKIFADGRRIPPVELLPQKDTNSSVRVFLFNEFLSEAECDGLRRVHDKHVQDMATKPLLCFDSLATLRKHLDDVRPDVHVTPNDFVHGTKCLNASFSQQLGTWMSGNWSYSTAFYPGESRFSTIFAARVKEAMGLDGKNGGKFQITSYPTGKAYKAHTDCVLNGSDQRDRVATVMVYLDDVEDGGETRFPELGIWVKPRKGRALVWNNMSPQGVCEPHSLHVASKVNLGSKYILIRWYYYKSFYSLGKRPPEPSKPTRPAGTPRVSCDDYDNGSCRWYDEWNNDHLLDYEYKKYTFI